MRRRVSLRGLASVLLALLVAVLATAPALAAEGAAGATEEPAPSGARSGVPFLGGAPSPSPPAPQAPVEDETVPPPPAPAAPTGNACERGQYGDVLPDGTVDAGCDGVLGFAEQRSPLTLQLATDALDDERVAMELDQRRVPGRVVRVDEVSARGGTVERASLLYVAPRALDGRDSFSLWTLSEGFEREVRVVVDVTRASDAGRAAPPRGVLLREAEAVAATSTFTAFDRATRSWVPQVLLVVFALVVVALVWAFARQQGFRPRTEPADPGPSRTSFTQGR